MKQLTVNIIFFIGDVISKTFIFNYGWGYELVSKILLKSVSLQEKWNLGKPWNYPNNNRYNA